MSLWTPRFRRFLFYASIPVFLCTLTKGGSDLLMQLTPHSLTHSAYLLGMFTLTMTAALYNLLSVMFEKRWQQ